MSMIPGNTIRDEYFLISEFHVTIKKQENIHVKFKLSK